MKWWSMMLIIAVKSFYYQLAYQQLVRAYSSQQLSTSD